MKYLTKEQMEKLPTPRLLAYFKKHLRGKPPIWDYAVKSEMGWFDKWEKEINEAWEQTRKDAKEILAFRSHVEKSSKNK